MIANNQLVEYTFGDYIGIGKVVGVATTEMTVVGFMYIVQDLTGLFPNEEYSYGTFSVQQSFIKAVE